MRYDERSRYREGLERTVLESADVRPDAVLAFLEGEPHHEAAKRLLTWPSYYVSALRHLTAAYATFVEQRLVIPFDQAHLDYDDFHDRWGVGGDHEFYPVAPNQGPFLDLLRHDEGEGLRLIHALANHAADAWRRSPDGRSVRPVMVRVGSVPRPFWGDGYVYGWFRTYTTGPKAVACALSALEWWVEEQVASGRDPAALFEAVLGGSRNVAVPALLLGVAMADPFRHLEGALPLVTAPRLWVWDIGRFTSDRSYGDLIHAHRDQTRLYLTLRETEKRAQRGLFYRTCTRSTSSLPGTRKRVASRTAWAVGSSRRWAR